jgi:PEP-CTERM motif
MRLKVIIVCPMKLRSNIWLFVISLAVLRNASGQDFVNLDFEDATIVLDSSSSLYPYAVDASQAIPGWSASPFFYPSDIFYNTFSINLPSVSILDNSGPSGALDGTFSVALCGGTSAYPNGAYISQTGLVPADAASILFIAQGLVPQVGGTLLVSLGGQNITFAAISTGPNYTLYGGIIPSALAGQIEQLKFSAHPDGGNNCWEVDDIQFSSSSIPEPSVFGLLALGGLFFGLRRSK